MSKTVLLICTGNSCRSQMAEGILKKLSNNDQIFSAGIRAELYVNPYAVRAMQEIGIDISEQYPKNVTNFLHRSFDYVITLCDNARDNLPNFNGDVLNRIHISIPDPAEARGNEDNILNVYRNVRDMIEEKIKEWFYSEFEANVRSA